MLSSSNKKIAQILFLINLILLFALRGGRDPLGLSIYHSLSVVIFLLTLEHPFPTNKIYKPLWIVLGIWTLPTLFGEDANKGWVHLGTTLIHALNFLSFLRLNEKKFTTLILGFIVMSGTLMALMICAGELTGYLEIGIQQMSETPMNHYQTFFPNGNFDADYLNCGILISAFYLIEPKNGDKLYRKMAIGLLLILLSGFTLLFSRGSILALTVAVAAAFFTDWKKMLRMGIYGLVFLLLLFNFSERIQYSLLSKIVKTGPTSRVTVWEGAFEALKEKPIIGWGLGGFEQAYRLHRVPMESEVGRYEKTTSFAHNEYLQIAVETGFTGLIAWLILLWLILKSGIQLLRLNPNWVLTSTFTCTIGFLTHAIFDFNLHLPIIGFLLSIFFAILTGPQADDLQTDSYNIPARLKPVVIPILFVWLGFSLYAMGTHWIGKTQIAKAVKLNPFSRELLHRLMDQPLSDHHVTLVKKSLKFHQRDDRAQAYLARNLYRRGDFNQSIKAYQKAITNNPKNPFYLAELADIYLINQNVAPAISLLGQAIELEPFYLFPRYRLGEIYLASNKKHEALQLFMDIKNIKDANLPQNSNYTRRLLNLDPKALDKQIGNLKKQMDQKVIIQ